MITRPAALIAAVVLAALAAGCEPPTYRVLTGLPTPPSTLRPAPRVPPPPSQRTVRVKPAGPSQVARRQPGVPEGWVPQGREQPWRHIVIHHSATNAGSAASFDRVHRESRGFEEMAYHFVITNGRGGADGAVEIGPRWPKQKWGAHCGGTPDNEYNDYGIGICLVGTFEKRLPSAKQLASVKKLVRFLQDRYKIPAANVIGHQQAPNARTKCPGRKLQQYLNGAFRREIPP